MASSNLILTLGKVIVAAAWVDGEVTMAEINSLKDLLFQLPRNSDQPNQRLTELEWAQLEIYLDSPVEATERTRLIEELKQAVRTSADKKLVMSTLESVMQADGLVNSEERKVLAEVEAALDEADTSLFGQLAKLVNGAVARRSEAIANAPNREAYFEDFVKNKVFFALKQRLERESKALDISDDLLRKLSLAGGLMARVAYVDERVTVGEFSSMVHELQNKWNITREAAMLVTEVAVSEVSKKLDYFRLSREFSAVTTIEERVAFVDVLYEVAEADGDTSLGELNEINDIAHSLYVTQQHLSAHRRSKDKTGS